MSVEFDEERKFNETFNRLSSKSSTSGLAEWLMKTGIAKDEDAAKFIMIAIAVICFSLSIFFLLKI